MLSDPSLLFVFLLSVPPLLGRAVLSTGITGTTMGKLHSVFSSFEWLYPVMIHKMKGKLDSELSLSFFWFVCLFFSSPKAKFIVFINKVSFT